MTIVLLSTFGFAVGAAMSLANGTQTIVLAGVSMQHGETREPGLIDNGDSLFIKPISSRNDVTTYCQGKGSGYKTYGDYGDVIAFSSGSGGIRVVHRAVFYVHLNISGGVVRGDVPELSLHNVTGVNMENYGWMNKSWTIVFQDIYNRMARRGEIVREGFITKGDNFVVSDQEIRSPIVSMGLVYGKVIRIAENELTSRAPAEVMSIIAVTAALALPFVLWMGLRGRVGALGWNAAFGVCAAVALAYTFFLGAKFWVNASFGGGTLGPAGLLVPACVCLSSVAAACVILNAAERISGRIGRDSSILAASAMLGLNVPAFIIFASGIGTPIYIFAASTVIAAAFFLRCDWHFAGMEKDGIEKNYAPWSTLLFIGLIIFIIIFIMTPPPYMLLVFGWAACAIPAGFILWTEKGKKAK